MSLLLFIFYWIGIPALVLLATRWLFQRARTQFHKGLVVAVGAAGLLGLLWLAQGEKWMLDRQVTELCAKDGGVKVYETVGLPPDKFNQWGQPNFYKPNRGENALGQEYLFKQDTNYYRQGNPEMSKTHYQVFRKSDNKLLGETIFYGRGGGDLPGPWHDSSYVCPPYIEADSLALLMKLFVKFDH